MCPYHSAHGDATALFHLVQGGLEVITADILKVNVDSIGGEPLEGSGGGLLLVVEARVEAQLLGDEVELLVGSDGSNDGQALALGDLADDLADGTGGGADEDGLTLLGLADPVKAGPGGQARHAQRAEEQGQVEAVGVLDLADHGGLGVLDAGVLRNGDVGDDGLALGEAGRVALEDGGDDRVGDALADLEGRRVRLDAGVAHLAAQVRIEGGVEDLEDEAALGGRVNVDGSVLDSEMLPGHGHARGDLLEDERLVGGHVGGYKGFAGMLLVAGGGGRAFRACSLYYVVGLGGEGVDDGAAVQATEQRLAL